MNRILVGSSNNSDKIDIDITENTNILIKDKLLKKYTFNVYNANLNIFAISLDNSSTSYEINIYKGNVIFNCISYNSKDVNMNVNLNNEFSNIVVHNSLVAIKKQNYNIKVNHNASNTNSDIYNNGITKKDGAIIFNVSSYVPKKSFNSKINQDSKIINLNDNNLNQINPVLLIDEYDSEARHAAFIGNIKEKELFYLMSRGLSKQDATNLLINGLLIGSLEICFDEKQKLKKLLIERKVI